MGQTRVKFTIRPVMIAVALMAVALVAEPFFFHSAVNLIKSHDQYLVGEAIAA
jgi:hypothetical protein